MLFLSVAASGDCSQLATLGNELHNHVFVCRIVQEIGISHLHIPTVDYLYAPPVKDLHRGVQFIAGGQAHRPMLMLR